MSNKKTIGYKTKRTQTHIHALTHTPVSTVRQRKGSEKHHCSESMTRTAGGGESSEGNSVRFGGHCNQTMRKHKRNAFKWNLLLVCRSSKYFEMLLQLMHGPGTLFYVQLGRKLRGHLPL